MTADMKTPSQRPAPAGSPCPLAAAAVRLPPARRASSSGRARSRGWANWPANWAARRVLLVTDPGLEARRPPAAGDGDRCEAGLDVFVFDGVEGEPDRARTSTPGVGVRPNRTRIDCIVGRRRRQLDGLRQGDQLPPDQRRPDGRLQGLRQGDEADAAVDRRADHGRHRQRGPVATP